MWPKCCRLFAGYGLLSNVYNGLDGVVWLSLQMGWVRVLKKHGTHISNRRQPRGDPHSAWATGCVKAQRRRETTAWVVVLLCLLCCHIPRSEITKTILIATGGMIVGKRWKEAEVKKKWECISNRFSSGPKQMDLPATRGGLTE